MVGYREKIIIAVVVIVIGLLIGLYFLETAFGFDLIRHISSLPLDIEDIEQPLDISQIPEYEEYRGSGHDGMILERDAGEDEINNNFLMERILVTDCSGCSSCNGVDFDSPPDGVVDAYLCDDCSTCEGITEANRFENCIECEPALGDCSICEDVQEEYSLCKDVKKCILEYTGNPEYYKKYGCIISEIDRNENVHFDINTLINVLSSCKNELITLNVGHNATRELCFFNNASISYYDFERPQDFYVKTDKLFYRASLPSLQWTLCIEEGSILTPFKQVGGDLIENYRAYVAIEGSPDGEWEVFAGLFENYINPLTCTNAGPYYKLGNMKTDENGFGHAEFIDFPQQWKDDVADDPELNRMTGIFVKKVGSATFDSVYAAFYANEPESSGTWSGDLRYANCNFNTDPEPYLEERPWWVLLPDDLDSPWSLIEGNVDSSVKVFYDSTMPGGGFSKKLDGDVDKDGMVNILDVLLCNLHWGEDWPPCDWDNDGIIGVDDVMFVGARFGDTLEFSRGNLKLSLGRLDTDFMRNCKFDIYICGQEAFAEYEEELILTLSDFLMNFNPTNVYKKKPTPNNEIIIIYNYFEFDLDKDYTIEEIESAIKTGFRLWEQDQFIFTSYFTGLDWLSSDNNDGIYENDWYKIPGVVSYGQDCWSAAVENFIENNEEKAIIGNCPSDVCGQKLKVRVAFKYKEPNVNDPWKTPLYPTITFCGLGATAAAVCGNGVCESGEDISNCPADCLANNLEVFAFENSIPVGAMVAIGLGDVNWDGVVNDNDIWFFNTTHNPNSCFNTAPGHANWNIDCDMNLDNRVNALDQGIVNGAYGNTIPIFTTTFATDLAAGTYELRAKYKNQIQNNTSVVILPGEKTTVYFNFTAPICVDFVSENDPPGAIPLSDYLNAGYEHCILIQNSNKINITELSFLTNSNNLATFQVRNTIMVLGEQQPGSVIGTSSECNLIPQTWVSCPVFAEVNSNFFICEANSSGPPATWIYPARNSTGTTPYVAWYYHPVNGWEKWAPNQMWVFKYRYCTSNLVYVADGIFGGLRIIDAADSTNPVFVGSTDTPGLCFDVYVSGDYAYVADGIGVGAGLRIYDVADPTNPTFVSNLSSLFGARGVYVSGDYAYVADASNGLRIVDVSDPSSPVIVGGIMGVFLNDLYVSGQYAYLAHGTSGFRIVNVADPTNPTLVSTILMGIDVRDVHVSGNYAYLADSDGLKIVNIANKNNPTVISSVAVPTIAQAIFLSGQYAYLVDQINGLRIVDVSDPNNPVVVGSRATGGSGWDVHVSGDYAYVVERVAGLRIVDVSDPSSPVIVGTYDGPGITSGVFIV